MEEMRLLDEIAVEVSLDERQGDFLRAFALAWQKADRENKELLFPVWAVLICKHRLDEEYDLAQGGQEART